MDHRELTDRISELQTRADELRRRGLAPAEADALLAAMMDELVAARDALRAAEEARHTLDAVLASIPDCLTIVEVEDGHIRHRWSNEPGRRLIDFDPDCGRTLEEYLQQIDVLHADGQPAAAEELPLARAVRQGQVVQDEEWTIRHPDGRRIPLLCAAAPIRAADGTITGGVVTYRGIEARKRTEEALRASEVLYRTLVETSDALIGTIDGDGRLLFLNSAAAAFLGMRADDLIGRVLWEFLDGVSPDPEALLRRVLASRTAEHLRATSRRDGRERFFETTIQPLDGACEAAGAAMIVAYEVTAAAEAEAALATSERQYRTLVEQVPAVVYTASADSVGTTTFISPQVQDVLGYSVDQWRRDPGLWVKLIHPEDREAVLAKARAARDAGLRWTHEYRAIARDGRIVWLRNDSVPVRDDQGRILFRQGLLQDITEQKRQEQAL